MRPAPTIKPWHEEYVLSDTSWTGLRLLVGDHVSVVAGCPREKVWPDTSMKQQCIWPGSASDSVMVDWEYKDGGGFKGWYPVLEEVSTGTIREILIEYAEREQQIQLLERHIQQHPSEPEEEPEEWYLE